MFASLEPFFFYFFLVLMKFTYLFSLFWFFIVALMLTGCSQPPQPTKNDINTQSWSITQDPIQKEYISWSTMISYTTTDENLSIWYFWTIEITANNKTIALERYDYIAQKSGSDPINQFAIVMFDAQFTDDVVSYFSGITPGWFEVSWDDGAGKGWLIFPDPQKKVIIQQVWLSAWSM